MSESIRNLFTESIQTKIEAADTLAETIAVAGERMVGTLVAGGKILSCGNGGAGALSQHFSTLMTHRFDRERPGLPAICLATNHSTMSAIAADQYYEEMFSRSVRTLGNEGDILLAISTSGSSIAPVKAIEAALSRDMTIIALTGKDGGKMAGLVGSGDVEVRVPSNSPARILEVQMLVIHSLCEYIDNSLFGEA